MSWLSTLIHNNKGLLTDPLARVGVVTPQQKANLPLAAAALGAIVPGASAAVGKAVGAIPA